MLPSTSNIVLLTGATGTSGWALLRLLEAKGVAVQAMRRGERDVSRLVLTAATPMAADFENADSLRAALSGVRSAYLVTPSSSETEAQQIRFAEAAAEACVGHLVKLSQFAADGSSPVRFLSYHAAVERRIRDLGIGYTFLRPNLFFSGFLAFRKTIAEEGQFFAPIGDARVSAVDVRDIAAVAAAALTEPGHMGMTYTISGPAAITHHDVARAILGAIGRDVRFVDVPPEAFAAALRGVGVPPWQADGLVEDYAHYARGEVAEVTTTVRDLTGEGPRDIAGFARDHARAFDSG
jgi:uncharacterized protein YbjT (DUF2867 family)